MSTDEQVTDPELAAALSRLLDEARRAARCVSWIDDTTVLAAAPASESIDAIVTGLSRLLGVDPYPRLVVPDAEPIDEYTTIGVGIQARPPADRDDEVTARHRRPVTP